jgi:RNA polymerase sigma-70 factor (ECF subfamily)
MAESAGNRQKAYEAWVQEWAPGLYRLAVRLCGKRDLAEDLVQETFREAWKFRDILTDPDKARAWLFQILRNRWSHYLRDAGRRLKPTHSAEALEGAGARGPDAIQQIAESDFVQRALERIEEDLKLPFLLVVMEGYTCQEAADALKIPLGTVLSRLHRARQALRGLLQEPGATVAEPPARAAPEGTTSAGSGCPAGAAWSSPGFSDSAGEPPLEGS